MSQFPGQGTAWLCSETFYLHHQGSEDNVLKKSMPLISFLLSIFIPHHPRQLAKWLNNKVNQMQYFSLFKYNGNFDHSTFKEQIHSHTDNHIPLAFSWKQSVTDALAVIANQPLHGSWKHNTSLWSPLL